MLGVDEIDININVLSNNESELFIICFKNFDKKGVRFIILLKCIFDDNDCDIVFVKCVVSLIR